MRLSNMLSTINKGLCSTKPVAGNAFFTNYTEIKNVTKIVKNGNSVPLSTLIKSTLGKMKYKISRPIIKLIYLGSLENNRKLFTEYLSKNFSTIKSGLANTTLEKSFLEKINSVKTPDELCSVIFKHKQKETMLLTDKINLTLYDPKLTRAEKDLIINQEKHLNNARIFELEKALSVKSTNNKCIELEQYLKDKFGLETVLLNDDYKQGQKILKACKLLKSNGQSIPKNFIVSNSIPGSGQALQKQSCVLINSSKSVNISNQNRKLGWSSSNDDLHELIHECGHVIQPLNIYTVNIPNKFKNTIKTLSGYANKSKSNAEIWAELFAKKYLSPQKFTAEEELLFQFLSN